MIYLELFWIFFKIGLFTIGGGYAMIPMINEEIVGAGYMTSDEVYNLIGIAQMTPGPFALNASTFCGMKIAGVLGAVTATFGMILPSAVITTIVAVFFYKLKETEFFKRLFSGLKPVAIGLIGATIVTMVFESLLGLASFDNIVELIDSFKTAKIDWLTVAIGSVIAGLSAFALIKYKVHPIIIVLIGAGLGIIIFGLIL